MDHMQEHQLPDTSELGLHQSFSDSAQIALATCSSEVNFLEMLRKAREESRRKSIALANTSHELLAPLNSILSYLQILEKGLCDSQEEIEDVVRCTSETARYMFSLVQDLLDSAKADSGQLSINLREVSVRDLITSTANTAQHEADRKSINLRLMPFVGDLSIRADAQRARQALTNLVMNGIKFTPIGGVVSIQVVPRNELGEIWCEVSDNGPGIASSEVTRIFDPFHRSAEVINREPGAGLGLSIARKMVELMGGYIAVHSEQGVGSNFRMCLQTFEEDGLKNWRRSSDGKLGFEPSGPEGGKLALVVEQNSSYRNKAIATLNELGYRTAWAPTAQDGMDAFEELNPDMLFASYGLPQKPSSNYCTGFELLLAVMDEHPITATKLVLIGGPSFLIHEKLAESGAQSNHTVSWMSKLTLLNPTDQLRETFGKLLPAKTQSPQTGEAPTNG